MRPPQIMFNSKVRTRAMLPGGAEGARLGAPSALIRAYTEDVASKVLDQRSGVEAGAEVVASTLVIVDLNRAVGPDSVVIIDDKPRTVVNVKRFTHKSAPETAELRVL